VGQLPGGRTLLRPIAHDPVALRKPRRTQSSKGRHERTDTPSEFVRVHGARLHELMRATQDINANPLPRIAYSQLPEAGPEAELSAVANVFGFVLDRRARKEATRPGSPDAGKEINERSGKIIIPK
jgi:hypothetical protein